MQEAYDIRNKEDKYIPLSYSYNKREELCPATGKNWGFFYISSQLVFAFLFPFQKKTQWALSVEEVSVSNVFTARQGCHDPKTLKMRWLTKEWNLRLPLTRGTRATRNENVYEHESTGSVF
jgi:hypothetical protein